MGASSPIRVLAGRDKHRDATPMTTGQRSPQSQPMLLPDIHLSSSARQCVTAALGGLLAVLFGTACGSQPAATEPTAPASVRPAVVVVAETVRRGDIQQVHTYSGE